MDVILAARKVGEQGRVVGIDFASEIGGALWLAYRQNGVWEIVFDGNGTIPCSTVDQYQFPVAMVAECWDEVNQQPVTR
ncbi:hypothetical protein MUP65_00480 [Patescibacteria group bacterium]|nr:hypothetical protein [Patescibacteria group bacterium]